VHQAGRGNREIAGIQITRATVRRYLKPTNFPERDAVIRALKSKLDPYHAI